MPDSTLSLPVRLFLDDFRLLEEAYLYTHNRLYLEPGWVVVTSHAAFVEYLQNNPIPDFISFDHDLSASHYGDLQSFQNLAFYDTVSEKTGYHSALYLLEHLKANGAKLPTCTCHSMNPYGRANIEKLLGCEAE